MLSVMRYDVATICILLQYFLSEANELRGGTTGSAKEEITHFEKSGVISWQYANDHCQSLNKQLCVRKNLCRMSGSTFPPKRITAKTERWVPVSDDYNDWVYLGPNPTRRCKKISEIDGPPSWGRKNCSDAKLRKIDKKVALFCSAIGDFYCCKKTTRNQQITPHPVSVYIRSRLLNGQPYYSFSLEKDYSINDTFFDQAQWRNDGRLPGDLAELTLMSSFVKNKFEQPIFFCTRSVTTTTRLHTHLHKASMSWCTQPWMLNFYLYGSLFPAKDGGTQKLSVGMAGQGSGVHSRISPVENADFPVKFVIHAPSIKLAQPARDGCGTEIEILSADTGLINSPNFPGKFNRGATQDISCSWKIKTKPKNLIRITFKTMKLTEAKKVAFFTLQPRSFQAARKTSYNFEKNCLVDKIEIPGYGKFCGNVLPPSFVTTSNEVDILFFGSRSNIGTSFSLFYEAIYPPNGLIMAKASNERPDFTWSSAQQECEQKAKTLCTADDICNFDTRPFYGVEHGDQWAPILDEYNDWIQIGRGNVHTCRKHNKAHGPPKWGVVEGSCAGINISNPCPIRKVLYCCNPGKTAEPGEIITVNILSTIQNGVVFFKYIRDGIDTIRSFDSVDIWTARRKRKGDFTSIKLHTQYEPGIGQVIYFCSRRLVPGIGRLTYAYSMFLQPCESKGWKLLYYLYSLNTRMKNTFKHYIGMYQKWPYHSRAHFQAFPRDFQGVGSFILYSFAGDGRPSKDDIILDMKDPACSGNTTVITAPSVLESPGYPTSYENGMLCTWHIKLSDADIDKGRQLRIVIDELSLEDPVDTLTVYEVASTVELAKTSSSESNSLAFKSRKSYTGIVRQISLTTPDTFLAVFSSDESVPDKGFRLRAEVISNECGGSEVGNGDEITSPNYPYGYSLGLKCRWTLRAPSNDNRIVVEIVSFDLANSSNCLENLRLNGDDHPPLVFCGGQAVPPKITFDGRSVNITFKTKAGSRLKPVSSAKGFKLRVFYLPTNNATNEKKILERQCGIQTLPFPAVDAAQDRIIGGTEAKNGNFPWIVMIGRPGVSCGGSLLNERWVLTATHCFIYEYMPTLGIMLMHDKLSEYIVIAGRYERNKPSPGEQHFNISDIYMHGGFKRYQVRWAENGLNILGVFPYNDISLARLSANAVFSPTVSPVCLPTQDAHVGEFCYVAGWGSVLDGSLTMTSALKYAKVPILDSSLCGSWKELKGTIFDNALCAGYPNGGSDHCWGDSGGPLMCRGRYGNFYINGIVSWSRKCGGKRTPGVYTRVWPFYDWINSILDQF